jgi:hypothetical protein
MFPIANRKEAKVRMLSEDEFLEKFGQKSDGEYEDVKNLDKHIVWTEVDDPEGNGTFLQPGFHYVNRLSYIVSAKPWTDEDYEEGLEVQWCEFENEDDEDGNPEGDGENDARTI